MATLKYKVIASKKQYYQYCKIVWTLVTSGDETRHIQDEIDLLTLLIEKWDDDHSTFDLDIDPIRLLRSFMRDHKIKPVELAEFLEVSKGYVSDILNYKKGLSKEVIRKLAARFAVRQEAFNKPYKLKSALNAKLELKAAGVMNTPKRLSKAS